MKEQNLKKQKHQEGMKRQGSKILEPFPIISFPVAKPPQAIAILTNSEIKPRRIVVNLNGVPHSFLALGKETSPDLESSGKTHPELCRQTLQHPEYVDVWRHFPG